MVSCCDWNVWTVQGSCVFSYLASWGKAPQTGRCASSQSSPRFFRETGDSGPGAVFLLKQTVSSRHRSCQDGKAPSVFSDRIALFNFCSGLSLTAPCHSQTQREQETTGLLGCRVRGAPAT